MSPRTGSRLVTAGLGGLALGLVGAAAVLLVLAALRMNVDCALLTPTECALEQEVADYVGHLQLVTAGGCLALGAGLAIVLRGRAA